EEGVGGGGGGGWEQGGADGRAERREATRGNRRAWTVSPRPALPSGLRRPDSTTAVPQGPGASPRTLQTRSCLGHDRSACVGSRVRDVPVRRRCPHERSG